MQLVPTVLPNLLEFGKYGLHIPFFYLKFHVITYLKLLYITILVVIKDKIYTKKCTDKSKCYIANKECMGQYYNKRTNVL